MITSSLKSWLLPKEAKAITVWRGPFRGARMHAVPRDSLRKTFGVYEHELNDWLKHVLPCVDLVLDVGANDGYFTFGCSAAFRRLKRQARIVAYEPDSVCCQQLADGLKLQSPGGAEIIIEQKFVGKALIPGQTTLDALSVGMEPRNTLIKVDVEGGELDVIEGASRWLNASNYFLIEVHCESHIESLRERFAANNLSLELRIQHPLPLIGRESRPSSNCWLVTRTSR